jgi:hypothetical protein
MVYYPGLGSGRVGGVQIRGGGGGGGGSGRGSSASKAPAEGDEGGGAGGARGDRGEAEEDQAAESSFIMIQPGSCPSLMLPFLSLE